MRVKQNLVVRQLAAEFNRVNELISKMPTPMGFTSFVAKDLDDSDIVRQVMHHILLYHLYNTRGMYYRKEKLIKNMIKRNSWLQRLLSLRRYDTDAHRIKIEMMDPITKLKINGEPLDPVPPHRWATNVICGEGETMRMARITGPNKDYLFIGSPSTSSTDGNSSNLYDEGSSSIPSVPSVPSPDENAPVSTDGAEKSPPRKKNKSSKGTAVKSSSGRSRNTDSKNDSHVGEQTPHTSGKSGPINRLSSIEECVNNVCMRVDAAFSPQPIRVRDIPLPSISWTDSSELSLLMCFKEDIGLTERSSTVFRRHPGLNTRMRAILFDWLMEVCDVYKLRRVTYYLAIDYIDRYLSRTDVIPKNHLQLLGITCLFIAAKVEEIYPPKLAELAYVTDGACTDTDMLAKEIDILMELNWDMNPMTVTGWLCLYLQLASIRGDKIREIVRRLNTKEDDVIYPQFSPYMFMTASMLLDLCSLDDGMLQFKYSVIAASAVYFVLNREKALFVSGYTWDNIKLCVEWMIPFALVMFRTINMVPLICPREYVRSGSALRVSNPSIVLDEGHSIQNHVINLKMLEEVYTEIKVMRDNFKEGKVSEATGWSASDEGYDPSCVVKNPPKRKTRRKHFRTSSFAQAVSRGDSRVYCNSKHNPPVEISSESDNDQRKRLNENGEPVPSGSGITATEEQLPRSSSFEVPSSPLSIDSADFGPPTVRMRFIDEEGNRVERRVPMDEAFGPYEASSKQTYPTKDKGHQINDNQSPDKKDGQSSDSGSENKDNGQASDSGSGNRDNDKSSDSGSDKSQGSKRRRNEEAEDSESSDDDEDSNKVQHPRRKKSCCEKKRACGSMLASPKCSGLYLMEGQEPCFGIRMTKPDDPVIPPEPRNPPRPDKIKAS